MIIWAIVPVKPLRRGKSRLADVFSPEERTTLNKRLLQHTLSVLTMIPEIESTLVISRDTEALALARKLNARTISEDGEPHLNTALTRATALAKIANTAAVLIVPADLPELKQEDIKALIARAKEPPVVVIAPDRHEEGTNALLVYPAGLITYRYGEDSFRLHCQEARQAGARLEIIRLPSLQLDLDISEDIQELNPDTLHSLISEKEKMP